MRTRNKHVKTYLKNIHDSLIGTKSMKAVMMSDLRSTTNDYVADHPDCTLEDLCRDIGTPQEIALQYDTPDCIAQIKKKAKKYDIAKWLVLALCIGILSCIFIAFLLLISRDNYYVRVDALPTSLIKQYNEVLS